MLCIANCHPEYPSAVRGTEDNELSGHDGLNVVAGDCLWGSCSWLLLKEIVYGADGNALDLKLVHIDGSVGFLIGVAGVEKVSLLFSIAA